MNDRKSVHSYPDDYDYQDTEPYYIKREDYFIKQQEYPEIINKRFGSIPTTLERQDNILIVIGPLLVVSFVLISLVSAFMSMSSACTSPAVAEGGYYSKSLLK